MYVWWMQRGNYILQYTRYCTKIIECFDFYWQKIYQRWNNFNEKSFKNNNKKPFVFYINNKDSSSIHKKITSTEPLNGLFTSVYDRLQEQIIGLQYRIGTFEWYTTKWLMLRVQQQNNFFQLVSNFWMRMQLVYTLLHLSYYLEYFVILCSIIKICSWKSHEITTNLSLNISFYDYRWFNVILFYAKSMKL
jgi:hypothetical protein